MVALKKLSQHNEENTLAPVNKSVKNGIACPECGEGLIDTNPNKTVLTRGVAEKGVACTACGYKGYRAAIVTSKLDASDGIKKIVYK